MILKNYTFLYLIFLFINNGTILIYTESTKNNHATINETIKTIATEDEFLSLLDQKNPAVIMAIMDNCGYCKIVTPTYQKLAFDKRFKSSDKKHSKINFYQANGPNLKLHKHIARETKGQFKIPGYPSFIFIKNGKIVDVLIGGNEEKLEEKLGKLTNS